MVRMCSIENVKQRLALFSIVGAASLTLLFELVQTRILSFIFWNHLVYLTVSLALLGFGISGTLVALVTSRHKQLSPRWMSTLWFAFGTSMLAAVFLSMTLLPTFWMLSDVVKLGIAYLLYTLPFVFSGAILSLLLSLSGEAVGRLYAADLVASGLGCIAFFWLLPALGAIPLVCILAGVAFVIGVLWSPDSRAVRWRSLAGATAAAGMAIAAVVFPAVVDFTPERYKGEFSLGTSERNAVIESTRWTPLVRIDVIGKTDRTNPIAGWYPEHPPGSYKVITQDGTAHTRLVGKAAIEKLNDDVKAGTERHLSNLVYRIRREPDVAVIGVGGGVDVASALAHGARSVIGAELNPAIAEHVTRIYAEYNGGLFADPRVKFVNREGRSFLRTTEGRFDILQVIAVDTFAALSSGAYVLSENYLYTVEAFRDYYAKLKPGGIVSFYRWALREPREDLRLVMLAAGAWRQEGEARLDQSIMAVAAADGQWALGLFRKGPFAEEEVRSLGNEADKRGGRVLFWPKVLPDQAAFEARYYGKFWQGVRLRHEVFEGAVMAFQAGKEQAYFATYPYEISPPTDDSPFFFEYRRRAPAASMGLGSLRGDGVNSTLRLILIQAAVLSILAIFLPLLFFQRAGLNARQAFPYSTYFASLGFGFMLIEIALVQKCVLFLGSPLHSLSAILSVLLVAAGLGSFIQSRLRFAPRRVLLIAGATVVALVAAYASLLAPLFTALLHLEFWARAAMIAVLLAPLGVVMGLFFPLGMQRLSENGPEFIPWAWGINGCTSVFGSVLAIALAISYGFSLVLWLGVACYIAAVAAGNYAFLAPVLRPALAIT